MSKVVITGVAGFLGSHVADHCIAEGFEVVGVDDLSGGFIKNVPACVTFVEGTVEDPQVVKDLWKQHGPFRYVYHLAAYAAEGLSHFIRRNEVECFVFTSSIAVYGENQVPMYESLEPKPEDPYGIAKYAVELDLEAAREMFGIEYVIFRPHNVYGPRLGSAL